MKRALVTKQFDYYNSDIVSCSWNLSKNSLNNILIDLNDQQFFLEKVNSFFASQRKERKEVVSKYEAIKKKIRLNGDDIRSSMNSDGDNLSAHLADQLNNADITGQSHHHSNDLPSAMMPSSPQTIGAQSINGNGQYPVSLKTFIEQKKRDKHDQPQKYDHSRVAKQFEFNYLTQDENVFKDYHYWDLSQKIRIAQKLFDKQSQEYTAYITANPHLNNPYQITPTTSIQIPNQQQQSFFTPSQQQQQQQKQQ